MRANSRGWLGSRASLMAAAVMAAGLSALVTPAAALAGPKPDARVQEILDGNELYIDQKQAKVNQLAYRPELISTKQSRGSVAFSTGAQARISKNSQLRLGSDCARLTQGQMLVSGKQNTCVGSVKMSVRGTHYIVEALDDGTTEVAVLDGQMTFSPGDTATKFRPGSREFAEREVLRFGPDGQLLSRRCMVAADYRRYFASDLVQGFFFPLPQIQALVSTLRLEVPGVTQLLGLLNTGGNRGLLGLPFGLSL
ncbi:FecR domain-containing protein [Cyanobium sp. FACHB-13342]|uniref:FecR domain-containing protein n=1 Tax=Cyanobium sp. FACHB-13342 TaxID=2692793 RepID=UPI001680CD94|nr:FecR domain-containing protein [Cyanobium sp. FACHB-13342]MBD2424035.1 FecR domain-containing protein [Cyanobium sp. FACHB-13342]